MNRLLLSTGNVVVSLIIGAIALALVGINYPETLDELITAATTVKSWIVASGLPTKYNVWVKLLLEEKQLVFMFFTIMARIALSLLTWVIGSLWARTYA
ncbi:MAG: hypothetical protein R3D68_10295 [Hyphomicrobiaceae bacterium]